MSDILSRLKILFFKKKISFIYLTEREGERERNHRQREREADSPLSREPNVALDPRTLRS